MAQPELLQSITKLSKKIDSLLDQQKKLQDRIVLLEKSNLELISQHENDIKMLEKANKEIEYLKVSYRLASSPEAIISARNKISGLIRTIDNCIRILNED